MRSRRFSVIYVIFIIFMVFYLLVGPVVTLVAYSRYEGETMGTVEHVESRRSRRHRKYKITYSYAVDDIRYEGVSNWGRSTRAGSGQEILVKYDPENPDDAMTNLEKAMAEATLCSGAVVGSVVVTVTWIQKRRRPEYGRAGRYGP